MKARSAVPLLGLFGVLSCLTGPKPVQYSPRLYLHQNQPKELWLTMRDGSRLTVIAPRVIDDTLFGWTPGGNEDLTVPVADIKSVEARRIDPIRTSIFPVVFLGAGIAVFTLVRNQKGEPDTAIGNVGCPDGECENQMP